MTILNGFNLSFSAKAASLHGVVTLEIVSEVEELKKARAFKYLIGSVSPLLYCTKKAVLVNEFKWA